MLFFERWVVPGETVPINAFKPRAVDAVAAAGVLYNDHLAILMRGQQHGVVAVATASKRETMQGVNVIRVLAVGEVRFEVVSLQSASTLPPSHPASRFEHLYIATVHVYEDVCANTPLGLMLGPAEFSDIPQQLAEAKVMTDVRVGGLLLQPCGHPAFG